MGKLYAFSLIFIVSVGIAAYILGTYVPITTGVAKEEIKRSGSAERLIDQYSGAIKVESNSPYPDSLSNFIDPYSYNQPSYSSGIGASTNIGNDENVDVVKETETVAVPVAGTDNKNIVNPTNTTNTNTNTNTNADTDISINNNSNPSSQNSVEQSIPVQANLDGELEQYRSTLNRKIAFSVPMGSKVVETGSATSLKFIISSPNEKKFTLFLDKVQSGCFDALASFSIKAGQGVDFRIIQDRTESMFKDKYSMLRVNEIYGTHKGAVGFRGNACIRTAIPTKIEIRASGFGRYEGDRAYQVLGKMIDSLEV